MNTKALIKNVISQLFPLTVSGVLARFERDVQKLKALAENHRAAAEAHEQLAEDFYAMAEDHHDEADRAISVAHRIANLID
jgi:hypothetical protein